MRFSAAFVAVLLAGVAPAGATVTIEQRSVAAETMAAAPAAVAPVSNRGWLALVVPGLLIGLVLIGRSKPRSPQSVTA